MTNHTRHQEKIIRNYYDNRESIALQRVQEIITELSTSLDRDKWDGAENLLGIYNYVSTALTTSHISRDPAVTREAIDLLEPLRQGWHDAAASLPAASEGGHGLG